MSCREADRLDRLAYLDSPAHRLDPRAKLLATLAFVVAVVSFPKYEVSALAPYSQGIGLFIYFRNLQLIYRHGTADTDSLPATPGQPPRETSAIEPPAADDQAAQIAPDRPAEPRSLEEVEIDAIRSALDAAGGNISEAAKRLGVSRNTIYRKLRWNRSR